MARSPGQIILLSARIFLGAVTVVLFVALFFWVAGRFDWTRGWAFVPATAAVVCLIIRTALEDRTLQKELDGYEAYTQNVRHRLLPGVW